MVFFLGLTIVASKPEEEALVLFANKIKTYQQLPLADVEMIQKTWRSFWLQYFFTRRIYNSEKSIVPHPSKSALTRIFSQVEFTDGEKEYKAHKRLAFEEVTPMTIKFDRYGKTQAFQNAENVFFGGMLFAEMF